MPELPEVETVARGLQAVLPGRRILLVRLGLTDFIEDPAALERNLPGAHIESIRRYGKFLLLRLRPGGAEAKELSMQIHLGMTGRLVVCSAEAPIPPHTHVFISLDDGRELRYTDPRRFGCMRLLEGEARDAVLRAVGLDPLGITEAQFREALQCRRARIKALLLDQHVLGGMGNIYTDESLWRARIHPARLAAKLSEEEIHRLFLAVRGVLREAIALRGSSISDFVGPYGSPGEFQRRHRVYGREGLKCFRCESRIRRVVVAGRGSWFCPRCQRAPRNYSVAGGTGRAATAAER